MLTWIKGWFTNSDSTRSTSTRSNSARANWPQSSPASTANRIALASETEVISLRIKLPASPRLTSTASPPAESPKRRPRRSKQQVPLSDLKFATKNQLAQLRQAGIVTAGDLARCDPQKLAEQKLMPIAALGWLKRQRRAAKLFIRLGPLKYFDATLLLAIHRKSIPLMASENPVRLYRDIQRFSLSSSGIRLLGTKPSPTQKQIERWVKAAKRLHPGKFGYVLNTQETTNGNIAENASER